MNDYHRVKELFHQVLEREPAERDAYLNSACNGDGSLRAEVESMIACFEPAESFIETPAFEFGPGLLANEEEEPRAGKSVGPYRIIREIGRGGMGTVYLAARADDEYQKQVAIKLIKRGMDTDFIVQRFRNERQILAHLDHPNIARLLDGGATDEGLPFFIMEFIDGKPIDEYCESKALTTVDRLKLFLVVCSAVSYAHRNLVIHRDLKPGNILITSDGSPRLLDFGIAKLLNPELSAETIDHTATVLRLMTPDYASPEQVKGESITTASDVYSLGVLLFELLTGHRPYRLKTKSPEEIERVICRQEPGKPSDSLAGSGIHKSDPQLRAHDPKSLRGDLDNIVLMAMRKEPARRYSSVDQFADDIRRHLEGLPVVARKDTFSYRTSKFIRRNKVAVAAAAAICLTLLAGIAATGWEARVAARQARLAAEQRDAARIESAKAERINKFLQDMFASANSRWYSSGRGGKGEDTRVVDVLNQAAQRLETELNDQPEVKAELHRTIGNTYLAIGRADLAVPQFRASLKIYRGLYGERDVKVGEALYYLASTLCGTDDCNAAEPAYREALEIQRSLPGGGNGYLPHILMEYANALSAKGDDERAEPLVLEAMDLFRKQYGNQHLTVAGGYRALAFIYGRRGDLDRAAAAARRYLDMATKSSEVPSEDRIDALLQLAGVLDNQQKYEEARRLLDEALDLQRAATDHSDTRLSTILSARAANSCLRHDYANAEAQANEAIRVARKATTGLNPQGVLPTSLETLGDILIAAGRPSRAESYLRESLAIRGKIKSPNYLWVADALGECLAKQKRYREAEPLLVQSYNDLKSIYPEPALTTVKARQRLVKLYEAWGKPEMAARYH